MRLTKLIRFSGIGIAAAAKSAFNQHRAHKYLVDSLLDQPGIPSKIAQLLAMRGGLNSTHATFPRLSIEEIRDRISEQSPSLAGAIESISDRPRVASLSQVHEAKLFSGERVAIKIQFPGIADEIAEQVDDFIRLAAHSPAKAYGFTEEVWGGFLREKLLEELDYLGEARYQQEFGASIQTGGIIIPEVYESLSTKTILVQSWEESISPGDFSASRHSLEPVHFRDAARLMVEMLAHSLFQTKLIHCDLNPGNYGFRIDRESKTTNLVLYDFGSMQRLSPERVSRLADLMTHAPDRVKDGWRENLLALGFDDKRLQHIASFLPKIMPELLQPFRNESTWKPTSWNPGKTMDETLGADKWWFRTAGPPWFLYLMRTLQGWHHGMKLIGEPVEVAGIFRKFIEQVPAAMISTDQAHQITNHGTSDLMPRPLHSKYLRVKVTEGRETVVELELPAAAIENLPDLVPEDVAQKIITQGLDLRMIADELLRHHAPQGDVFEMQHGMRHYRVWLD